jgi:hypothetical protein
MEKILVFSIALFMGCYISNGWIKVTDPPRPLPVVKHIDTDRNIPHVHYIVSKMDPGK